VKAGQTHYVLSYDFRCGQYDQGFIEFLKEKSGRLKSICPAKNDTDYTAIKKLEDAAAAQHNFHKNHKNYYLSEVADLANYGFKQGATKKGNPPAKINASDIIKDDDKTAYSESYYCMHSPSHKYGGAYKFFRITSYDDHPVPGSCSRGSTSY
jgi:hypothetical protein